MTDSHASDLYDVVNTWGVDDEFFLNSPHRSLLPGCSTLAAAPDA
ncbi:hypothetical protein [Arthrobacter sp. 260]|nr:hypothetical protein [Arthrobacter sp. 260]